jgi:hypothetical protein
MIRNLVEYFKPVDIANNVTTDGGLTSDYISAKNANNNITLIVTLKQAVGHATALSPYQATAVAGTSAKVLTNVCRIWANEDTATTDTLVRKTDALTYSVTADIKNKQIIFEIPVASLDLANGFDCINIISTDSSQATNLVSVTAFIDTRYKEDVPPAAITD